MSDDKWGKWKRQIEKQSKFSSTLILSNWGVFTQKAIFTLEFVCWSINVFAHRKLNTSRTNDVISIFCRFRFWHFTHYFGHIGLFELIQFEESFREAIKATWHQYRINYSISLLFMFHLIWRLHELIFLSSSNRGFRQPYCAWQQMFSLLHWHKQHSNIYINWLFCIIMSSKNRWFHLERI